jgi:hypothetical protein
MGSISFYRVGDYSYDELIGYWFDKKGQQHMTTTNTPWRSVKTDPPKLEDFPVVACNKYRSRAVFWEHDHHWSAGQCEYDYWRSIKCDPPPREVTQREKDAEAFAEYDATQCSSGLRFGDCSRVGWHAALAWEREDAEDAAVQFIHAHRRDGDSTEALLRNFFRARREGGGKK